MTRLDVFRRDGPAPRVDPLTGLPMPWERRPWPLAGNRLNLARDYPPAARPPAGLSFLAIDIDGMHRLNCEVGLQRADDVLVAIARAIQRIVDPAPVWRTGGDEFLTAVGGGREVAVDAATAIASAVRGTGIAPSGPSIDLFIGIAVASAGETSLNLASRADHACQRAQAARSPFNPPAHAVQVVGRIVVDGESVLEFRLPLSGRPSVGEANP